MFSGRVQKTMSRALRSSQCAVAALTLLLIAGCSAELHSAESALDPASPQAHQISSLMWLFIWVCVAVYAIVLLVLLGTFVRRRHGVAMVPVNDPITEPDPHHERRVWSVVSGAIIVTVITLFILLFSDFATGR